MESVNNGIKILLIHSVFRFIKSKFPYHFSLNPRDRETRRRDQWRERDGIRGECQKCHQNICLIYSVLVLLNQNFLTTSVWIREIERWEGETNYEKAWQSNPTQEFSQPNSTTRKFSQPNSTQPENFHNPTQSNPKIFTTQPTQPSLFGWVKVVPIFFF